MPNFCNTSSFYHAIYLCLCFLGILNDEYQRVIQNEIDLRIITPNDPANPIQESIVRTITINSTEQSQIGRVEFLRATITGTHYCPNECVYFPNTGNTYNI